MQGICAQCKQEFFFDDNRKRKFCNKSCKKRYDEKNLKENSPKIEKYCAGCSKKFESFIKNGHGRRIKKYCSHQCYHEHRARLIEIQHDIYDDFYITDNYVHY